MNKTINPEQEFILEAAGRFISHPGSTNQIKYAKRFNHEQAKRRAKSLASRGHTVKIIPVEAV